MAAGIVMPPAAWRRRHFSGIADRLYIPNFETKNPDLAYDVLGSKNQGQKDNFVLVKTERQGQKNTKNVIGCP